MMPNVFSGFLMFFLHLERKTFQEAMVPQQPACTGGICWHTGNIQQATGRMARHGSDMAQLRDQCLEIVQRFVAG